MVKTALLSVAIIATDALAEPYDAAEPIDAMPHKAYVSVGSQIGMQRDVQLGVVVDGGLRLGTTPLFVHGQLGHGMSGSGSYQQARVGLEARSCAGVFCGFVGADAGYQHDDVMYETFCFGSGDCGGTKSHDVLVAPRLGLEIGERTKLRTSIELPVAYGLDAHSDTNVGLSLTAGIGGSF